MTSVLDPINLRTEGSETLNSGNQSIYLTRVFAYFFPHRNSLIVDRCAPIGVILTNRLLLLQADTSCQFLFQSKDFFIFVVKT